MNYYIKCIICLFLFGLTEAQEACPVQDGQTKICAGSVLTEPYGNLTYRIVPFSQGGAQICCQVLSVTRGVVLEYVGNAQQWISVGCGTSTTTVKWQLYGKAQIQCSAKATSQTQFPTFNIYNVQWAVYNSQ